MKTFPLEIHDASQEKPPVWQTVIVQGGIAHWDGSEWATETGSDSGRTITWTVEWWASIPNFTRITEPSHPMKTNPETFTDKEVIDAIEEALELNRCASDYDRLPETVSDVLRFHLDCLKRHQYEEITRQQLAKELL